MKKTYFADTVAGGILVLTLLIFTGARTASAAQAVLAQNSAGLVQSIEEQSPARILINGAELKTEVPSMMVERVLFIPLSAGIAGEMGADFSVSSVNGAMSVTLASAKTSLVFTENQTQYSINGDPAELPVAPFQQSGYLMAPARELLQAFGFNVVWEETERLLSASDSVSYTPLKPGALDIVFAIPFQTEPVGAGIPAAQQSSGAPEKRPFEYTYENTASFENIAVSGASEQSNLIGTSAVRNQFNMRFQKLLENGYKLTGSMRTSESTDVLENRGAMDRFSLSMEKGRIILDTFDFIPKFSYFLMKNYQVRGLSYERKHKGYSWTALAGKSPKQFADSEYSRTVQGFRIHRAKTKDRDFGFSFVKTRDGGSLLSTARIDNSAMSINFANRLARTLKIQAEYSISQTAFDGGAKSQGSARNIQAQYRTKDSLCTAIYERTGGEFDSETTYFTAGRRETSTLCNRKLNKRNMLGAGFKTVLLGGEETRTMPFYFSSSPFKNREALKFTLQRNFEKAVSSIGSRFTDSRSLGYTDRFGSVRFDANYERRKQRENNGSVSFRTSQRYRLETFIAERLDMTLQMKRERRSRGSNPKIRYMQARFDYELKEWNDVFFTTSRYYNNTTNDRTDFSTGYRRIDIENDTEMNLEYKFYNYRDHNDNSVRVSYSFYK